MPSARAARPPLGLAIVLFLLTVDLGAAIQLAELPEAFARATRRGVQLWTAVGLAGQVLRIAGPILGTVLVLRRSPRSRRFWMALLAGFAALASLHLLVERPPQAGGVGLLPSVQRATFDLGAAESLRLLMVSLGWLVFWGTARGARIPFERPAPAPATGGFGGVAVAGRASRAAVSPWLVLGLLSGGAVAVLLLQAALAEDPEALTRLVSFGDRQRPQRVEPAAQAGRTEPVAEIELPGPVSRIVLGGSGRFLAVQLRRHSELLLLDGTSRSIIPIELPQPDAAVAMGSERLLVFGKDPPTAYVRLLDDLERAGTVPLASDGAVHLAAMGSHDPRRLYLLWRGEGSRLEIRDANDPTRVLDPAVDTELAELGASYLVASPHGDRLALGRSYCRRGEVCSESLTLADDGTVKKRPWIAPSNVSNPSVPRLGFGVNDRRETIPSAHAGYHLVRPPPRSRKLTILQGGTASRAVLELEVPELAGQDTNTLPNHLWLLPQAGLLVVVPAQGDRLVLYDVPEITPGG